MVHDRTNDRSNITLRIVNQLGQAIVSGEYASKALPIEAKLSEKFSASRSVTREAIKMLSAKGLVASRPRYGTYVAPEEQWNFLDPDILHWLLGRTLCLELLSEFNVFRSAIEPKAAFLASRRGDRASLDIIEAAINRMERQITTDREATLGADIEFHIAILHASGNRFLIQCRGLVETALRFSIQLTDREKGVAAADVKAHRVIADAILGGDSARAVSATQELLNEAAMLIERARKAVDSAHG
jgi:DNA-binding FadR family transcriptional regulator